MIKMKGENAHLSQEIQHMKKLAILLAVLMTFAFIPSFANAQTTVSPSGPTPETYATGGDIIDGCVHLYNKIKRALVKEEQKPSQEKKAQPAKQKPEQKAEQKPQANKKPTTKGKQPAEKKNDTKK